MNSRALELLEFNKIIDMLAAQAGSGLAKERIARLVPLSNERMVREALTETSEAVSVIVYKGAIPIGELGDMSGLLSMVSKGRSLTMRELLAVRRNLQIAREVRAFLTRDVPPLQQIAEMANLIEVISSLEQDIDRCILSEDEMADNASPTLRDIRRDIRNKNDSIRSRLGKYTGSQAMQKYLQDSIVTMRNGRYVIPVKREYAAMVPGLVHDQSQTGATLFIEPQAIVTLNNELKELSLAEEAEIARILAQLSGRVQEHRHQIANNQELLIKLDVINAKGKLSYSMDAAAPQLNTDGFIDIRCGRHPLIPADRVVPIDVELGGDFKTLLITGPNTGGKTATLKTIGLFILMALSGLHIPADESSKIPVLDEVYADIGDEQSIEQSLSTFSSHMKNIVEISGKATDNTLVLLDELGVGTDPTEGAALGIALLEALRERGALVCATTHYTELKKYALEAPLALNASMEFDVETLSPTYKLRLGLPGKSNAFEISRKLGLSEDTIRRAEELLDTNALEFENAVTQVEQNKVRQEAELAAAREMRREAEALLADARIKLERAEAKRAKLLGDAEVEARQILRDAQDTVDEIRDELRALEGSARGEIVQQVAASRKRLREEEKRYQTRREPSSSSVRGVDPATLTVGTRVKLLTIDQNGEVASLPDDRGNLQVRIGSIRMNANVRDLMLIESEPEGNKDKLKSKYARKTGSSTPRLSESKTKTISPSINLIGRTLDDARMEMEKYLDDVSLSGLKRVTIIHGKGEGILRDGLRQELRKNKRVKSFHSAPYNEGGEGATVVDLK